MKYIPLIASILLGGFFIMSFHHFVAKDGILQPMLLGIAAVSLYLLWAERARWKALIG